MARKDTADTAVAPPDNSRRDAARAKALEIAIQQIQKDFGEGAIMKMGERHRVDIDVLGTPDLGELLRSRRFLAEPRPSNDAVAATQRKQRVRIARYERYDPFRRRGEEKLAAHVVADAQGRHLHILQRARLFPRCMAPRGACYVAVDGGLEGCARYRGATDAR